ncbi:MAG: GTPase HflX [Planctomycetaceae bacterium]|jgi:GTP-binding protein HflX|nr:GTPase HflX [Planctomycetaceae bacterium]
MSSIFLLSDGGDSNLTKSRLDASTHADRMTRLGSVVRESAVLVGVYLEGQVLSASPLDELSGLAEAAQVREAGRITQRRRKPEAATYIGSGKLEELKELVNTVDANLVIFDNDLVPGQTKNLEEHLKVKVIDRTELILDIFASRARTNEARLAVELAQLEYSLPRLKRMWTHLERQGVGGVGLRGPGEKQLEVDRRLAQKRILDLKSELNIIQQRRYREVTARKTSRTVSLVGYTNAGKSTLLNRLTDSDVYVKDQLFATLDTRTRRWHLPGWGPVLLSDTVGFIRDLPHHLIASFRATLEEANQADLLLHIADASSGNMDIQIDAAFQVLTDIGIREKDTLLVLNKIDTLEPDCLEVLLTKYPNAVPISAGKGLGIDNLTIAVSDILSKEFLDLTLEIPVANGRLMALLARDGEILSKRYGEEIVLVHCRIPQHLVGRLRQEKEIRGLPENVPSLNISD